jgi:hypothetical protein
MVIASAKAYQVFVFVYACKTNYGFITSDYGFYFFL